MTTALDALKNLMVWLVESLGYLGLTLLSLLENLIPPIPSEFVVPFAGFLAADGRLDAALIVAATTVGSFVGTSAFYLLGRRLGDARIRALIGRFGRFVLLRESDYEDALRFFNSNDAAVVFWGRFVPGVRSLISLPAGVARMQFARFAGFTLLGTLLWNAALVTAGWFLGARWELVISVLDRVQGLVWALLAAAAITWIVVRRRAFRRS